ncbi:MAG: HhH-GPD-type base excision DNA repair protein [Acidimicrobiales bacterium]
MSLYLSGDAAADELLSTDPLALLIGMVLDQQIPLERAFAAPRQLKDRLGRDLDAGELATMEPRELVDRFTEKPALHRFPKSMAGRVQALCTAVVERFDGDPAALWSGVGDGEELLGRVESLPGFGEQKARIFVALLGKQLGVRPPGWRAAAEPYGEPGTFMSVADIDSPQALVKVRQYKQELKAAAKASAVTR